MGSKVDIGGFFNKLKSGAKGGRRSGSGADDGAHGPGQDGSPSGGGRGRLRDISRKAKDKAKSTADRVRRRRRPSVDRPRGDGTKLARRGTVTIEYSPQQDGDPDPGEVVWTWVPYEEDPSQGKDRPVVVIGRRRNSLVGIPLTTKSDDKEVQVNVGAGGWDPKRRTSYARVWRMIEIDADATRREGAVLDRERFDELAAVIDDHYDVRYPSPTAASDDRFDY